MRKNTAIKSTKSTVKTSARPDVYQMVTDKIITAIEAAIEAAKRGERVIAPWSKPWSVTSGIDPTSLSTGKPYKGMNIFLLGMAGYKNPYWVTFDEAKKRAVTSYLEGLEAAKPGITAKVASAIGAEADKLWFNKTWYQAVKYLTDEGFEVPNLGVKAGEKGSIIVYWHIWEKKEAGDDGKEITKNIPSLKYHTVFNAEQCAGIQTPPVPEVAVREFKSIDAAENIFAGMPNRPSLRIAGQVACYIPAADVLKMPAPESFIADDRYYQTLFHEMVHSTGHKSRLKRDGIVNSDGFGSNKYAKEELIAEMGAAMLCAHTGIATPDGENESISYLYGWLGALKQDAKLLVAAAGAAQKAVEYITGGQPDSDEISEA